MKHAVTGFRWDDGNWPKCAKHGVSKEEIEALFASQPLLVHPALYGAAEEERFLAIGAGPHGRWLFVVFTLRKVKGETLIRPVSALHAQERNRAL